MVNFFHRMICSLILTCLLPLPFALEAQESESHSQDRAPSTSQERSATRPVLNQQQRRGEALFVQNCPLCHIPSKQKKVLGIQGPSLQGVYGDDSDEDSLRQIIEQGFPAKMPGFRYALDHKQVGDLIAFLKAGAYLKTLGVAD